VEVMRSVMQWLDRLVLVVSVSHERN
jgi:hypothetical protein